MNEYSANITHERKIEVVVRGTSGVCVWVESNDLNDE